MNISINIEHFKAGEDLKKFIEKELQYIETYLSESADASFFISLQGKARYKTIININDLHKNFSSHSVGRTPYFSLSESRRKIMTQIKRKKKKIQAERRRDLNDYLRSA